MPRKGEPLHYRRPRADLSVPRDITALRKFVHFPTQAEAELRRRNRRRAFIARASLVLMALSPLGPLLFHASVQSMLIAAAATFAIFVACCFAGGFDNESRG